MTTKYSPLGNNVLIIPDSQADVSEGGIIIPEFAKKKLNTGTVHKKGPLVADDIEASDHVMWDLNSDWKLKLDGKDWVCVDANNILLIAKASPITHKYVPISEEESEESKLAKFP